MKKVLVLYFTQSGQLLNALKATFKNIDNHPEFAVKYIPVEPQTPFPFPWSYMEFFDAFPETVQGVPCPLKPLPAEAFEQYDLVVLGYQPWFLSVCRPIDSFLQTEDAKKILGGRKVVTLLACRNMWVNAQEKMKQRLKAVGAQLIGNITFVDRSGNLTSLVTVLAYTLGGVKGKFMGLFPKFGVPDEELKQVAWKFGDIISDRLKSGNFPGLQEQLVSAGAVKIKSNLLIMEGRGKKLFPLYAKFISRKGLPGNKARRSRVRLFGIMLPTLILILSPLITLTSRLTPLILPGRFRKAIAYFSGVDLADK